MTGVRPEPGDDPHRHDMTHEARRRARHTPDGECLDHDDAEESSLEQPPRQ